jgi:glucose-1-phosphate cytidylyltransferase
METEKSLDVSQIPVVIFCGGRGTRLKEETEIIPKPLVRVGGKPILWHIMKIYYAQGFRKFVLLIGYKGELIKEYFCRYHLHQCDFTIRPKDKRREIIYHSLPAEDWEISFIDTGADTQTGARLKGAEKLLKGRLFMLTYGDGVADVDLSRLLKVHNQEKKMITITGVFPPSRFGEIIMEGNSVVGFWEKPQVQSGYINGGFFAVNPEIFDHLAGDDSLNFEKDVLSRLAKEGNMAACPHNGYWQCMDTVRDMELLNEVWQSGAAPWKVW